MYDGEGQSRRQRQTKRRGLHMKQRQRAKASEARTADGEGFGGGDGRRHDLRQTDDNSQISIASDGERPQPSRIMREILGFGIEILVRERVARIGDSTRKREYAKVRIAPEETSGGDPATPDQPVDNEVVFNNVAARGDVDPNRETINLNKFYPVKKILTSYVSSICMKSPPQLHGLSTISMNEERLNLIVEDVTIPSLPNTYYDDFTRDKIITINEITTLLHKIFGELVKSSLQRKREYIMEKSIEVLGHLVGENMDPMALSRPCGVKNQNSKCEILGFPAHKRANLQSSKGKEPALGDLLCGLWSSLSPRIFVLVFDPVFHKIEPNSRQKSDHFVYLLLTSFCITLGCILG
ncbi:hypothetical protein Scep_007678 [Stephania cephalantha]|uniref:Uncharacterized protein n=1 Tax=Stephania cephalantha TaxID=152367 RepID=A0AAP0KAD2_9MAGN